MTSPANVTAIFLAEDESSLALDRKVLRGLGVTQTRFFASGSLALEHLRKLASSSSSSSAANGAFPASVPVKMLICNERLADMTGLRFLSHLRSLPELAQIPAIFLVSNGESATATVAMATNSCAVLSRPYSPEQASAALNLAAKPEARHAPLVLPSSVLDKFTLNTRLQSQQKNTSNQKQIVKRDPHTNRHGQLKLAPGEASLREGLAAMQRGDTLTAERLLRGGYETDPERVEICLAFSRLYSLLHKGKEELVWLCKAIALCLKRGEKTRAENLIVRLPRGREGQDPLLGEAGLMLQQGEAKASALCFLEAHRLDPSRPLHTLISRTCMFTPAPEEHMGELIKALSRVGHDATAAKLQWRLLQPPKEDEEKIPGFLDNFPMLCDIIYVASHTFKTWRKAA